jgi:hypothetical protein
MEQVFYPIRYVPGYGITARTWQIGGAQREVVRRHLRRLYWEGTQVAFCYHEGDERMHRQALQRVREFMNEPD